MVTLLAFVAMVCSGGGGGALAHELPAKPSSDDTTTQTVPPRTSNSAAQTAPPSASDTLTTTCSDAAADNYAAGAVSPGDNRACTYSCVGLRAHFELSAVSSECYIDAGLDTNWPPGPVVPLQRLPGTTCSRQPCSSSFCINADYCSAGNNTYTVPASSTVVIQGHAFGPAGDTRELVTLRGVTLLKPPASRQEWWCTLI
jgi:hypothetical protein